MTDYIIRISDKESLDWLTTLIRNTMQSPNSPVMINSYKHVKAWDDALSNLEVKNEPGPSRKKREQKDTDPNPFICKDHPKYGAKQAPRTECKACWKLYKQFHPMDYPLKRRAFERKQRSAR